MSSFTYKGCEFELSYKEEYKFNGIVTLASVSGKVLEIPDTYDEIKIESVFIPEPFKGLKGNVFEYHTPSPEDSSLYFVEEIHIPASLRDIDINRRIFPNLNKVVVDSENKEYCIVDDRLLCSKDNHLIAYFGNEELEEYSIPDGISSIGTNAFSFTKIHKINFPVMERLVPLDCARHSYFLQDFENVVEFGGLVHAFKKEVDEFVITDFSKLEKGVFNFSVPKKIVFDVKSVVADLVYFAKADTVELRNPNLCISDTKLLCDNFQHLIVNPENKYHCAIDDVLFSKDKTQLIMYPRYREGERYVVPEGTLEICPNAFCGKSCSSIQLPTTLLEFHNTSFCNLNSLHELIIPETDHAIKFESINAQFLKSFRFPKNINVLNTDSVYMGQAVVDATEIEYFGARAFASCQELIISKKTKYAIRGAFGSVSLLRTPELKLYRFVEAIFPENACLTSDSAEMNYVEVTRDDGSVWNLVFPILSGQDYLQAIFTVWGTNGLSVKDYVNAIIKVRRTESKYKAITYCLENNSGELVEVLLSRIGRMARGLLTWAVKNGNVSIAALLCNQGVVKPALAKELLKGNLPNTFVPIIMSVLDGRYSESRLSL